MIGSVNWTLRGGNYGHPRDAMKTYLEKKAREDAELKRQAIEAHYLRECARYSW